MAEKTTVAFRVAESVKEEWEQAAEEPEYDSLSHLIRLAVQREIADTGTEQVGAGTSTESNGEVLEALTRVERTVDELHDEVDAIGRDRQAGELYELEQVLLEILPAASGPLDEIIGLDEPEKLKSATTTARDLAGRIGADTSDVVSALERLDENTAQVQSLSAIDNDSTLYWREE